ncbi:MAG: four helix bundle protein [Victivallaceae bacterium]
MKNNIILDKSFSFALRIIKLNKFLRGKHKEHVISRQILRSGTSIGANMEEANAAQSQKDFFAKTCIAYKEACETRYWLKLLKASDYISAAAADSIMDDCEEIIKILSSIKLTAGNNLKK